MGTVATLTNQWTDMGTLATLTNQWTDMGTGHLNTSVDKRTGNCGHLNQTGDKNTELWPPKPVSGQDYGHIKQSKIIKVSYTVNIEDKMQGDTKR